MTKDAIYEKLQTEVTIGGLSPGTYYIILRYGLCAYPACLRYRFAFKGSR